MKFSAILLVICIFFLSSFSGMAKSVQPVAKKMCCEKSAKNTNNGCDKNDCNKEGCNMMLSCGICGFLVVEPLAIKPVAVKYIDKLFQTCNTGDIAAYHADNWKPPKV